MKYLSLSFVIFLIPALASIAFAAEPTEVVSLDNGSCWIKNVTPAPDAPLTWRVDSWGDSTNFLVSIPDLSFEKDFTAKLKAVLSSFEPSSYDVALYCYSSGYVVAYSFYEGDTPVCVRAKKSSNSNFELQTVSIDSNPNRSRGFCESKEPKTLFLKLKSDATPSEVQSYLAATAGFSDKITATVYNDFTKRIRITLTDQWIYREWKVKALLDQDAFTQSKVERIDYNAILHVTGESYKLGEGKFAGYPAPAASPSSK